LRIKIVFNFKRIVRLWSSLCGGGTGREQSNIGNYESDPFLCKGITVAKAYDSLLRNLVYYCVFFSCQIVLKMLGGYTD
jgi:hypothetical protein